MLEPLQWRIGGDATLVHPTMTCLVSSWLHHLPQHLALEFSLHSSGIRNAEVLAKLKAMILRDDLLTCTHGLPPHSGTNGVLRERGT